MAVGSTEIVTGFDNVNNTPYGPKVLTLSQCGKCGAAIFPGAEATHATWHNTGAWSQQAMTTRPSRTGWEANNP
jgi:hypothetical protein